MGNLSRQFSRFQFCVLGIVILLSIISLYLGVQYFAPIFNYFFIIYFLSIVVIVQNTVFVATLDKRRLDSPPRDRPLHFEESQELGLSSYLFHLTPLFAIISLSFCWTLFAYLLQDREEVLLPYLIFSPLWAVVLIFLGFALFLLHRFMIPLSTKMNQPTLDAIFPYIRLILFSIALQIAIILLNSYNIPHLATILTYTLSIPIFIILIEYTLNTIISVYQIKQYPFQINPIYRSEFLRALFFRTRGTQSFSSRIQSQFGIDITHIWIIGFIKKAALPVFLSQLLFFWALSCFIIINPGERGIHERFGRCINQKPLLPGPHLKLPYPFDSILVYNTEKIKSLVIGYQGDRKARTLLWTTRHQGREYRFLMGEGKELITINMDVNYKISDIFSYHYFNENVPEHLSSLAYKTVVEQTVYRRIDQLLSLNRDEFAERISREIQRKSTENQLGVKIVNISINEIHPPSDLAAAYQQVISSKINAVSTRLDATKNAIEIKSNAQMTSMNVINNQREEGLRKTALARGKTESFVLRLNAYRASPRLFKQRSFLKTLEDLSKTTKITIIDHTLLAKDNENIWLNLEDY